MGSSPPSGFAPYYSWVGAPAQFNGTNPLTGGDSCTLDPLWVPEHFTLTDLEDPWGRQW